MTTIVTITPRPEPDTGDCQVCGFGCCNCAMCLKAKGGRRDVHNKCLGELALREKAPHPVEVVWKSTGTGGRPV